MIYELQRIDNLEKSQSNKSRGCAFRRLVLKPDDYKQSHKVYFCDVVKGFRNEKNWRRVFEIGVGARIKNIRMKDNDHIDADSFPMVIEREMK